MATAAPSASSTKETTNYARLCRLLVDIGTQALRDTLDAIHPPANLHGVLSANKLTLQSLRAKRIINPIQWGKLFPAIPTSVSSRDFDTTLLMVLVRNLCGFTAPLTGWDALPVVTDLSKEADIARVKYFRNIVYGHAEKASVDDIKFNDYWRDIRDTLVRLGGITYEAAIDDLRNETMDPEVEDHYIGLLSQWKKDEDNIKDHLEEIMKKLDALVITKEVTDKGVIPETKESRSKYTMCKYHDSEILEYFCRKCKVCICGICGRRLHNDHTKIGIQQAAEEWKVPMANILFDAKAEIVAIERKINKQIELKKKSKERIAASEDKVTTTVEELIQVLRDHEKVVKAKLAEIEEQQEREHLAQLEKLQMFAIELKKSIGQGEGVLERDIPVEVLEDGNVVFTPCIEILSLCQKMEVLRPMDISYVINAGRIRDLVELPSDQVVVSVHLQSEAKGKGLQEAETGADVSFTITTRDSKGKRFYSEQEEVSVAISSPTGEVKERIADSRDGNYTVHYKPNCTGLHSVTVEINGWPLTGSPWRVNVKPHQYKVVKVCGSGGGRKGQLTEMWSIAKNEETGDIAVADHFNNRIQVFDENLKYVRTIGEGTGSQTGSAVKIGDPWSVAFLKNGDMIAIHGDEDSGQLSLITDDGRFIQQFSEHVINPWTVFVKTDDDGLVIVCDAADRRIKVLSPDGAQLLQSFSAPDCDDSPTCVFYHPDKFFVSYAIGHCVKVFNKEGEYLLNIGSEGSGEGQLMYPWGLVVDAFDNLIVCDSDNERLQMFTQDGEYLGSFGQEIQKPLALAVCENGDLLVTDDEKSCVMILR